MHGVEPPVSRPTEQPTSTERPGVGSVHRATRRGCSSGRPSAGCRSPSVCGSQHAPRCRPDAAVAGSARRPGRHGGPRASVAPSSRGWSASAGVGSPRPRRAAPRSRNGFAKPPSSSARRTSSSGRSSRAARACSLPSSSPSSSCAAIRCRPSRSTPSARSSRRDLGARLEDVFVVVRASAARRRLDRPGARGDAAHRRGGRRQGAAAQRVDVRAQGPARHGLARPAPRRPDPDRRARQSAGARRAVRRDHRRGARLPHGSGEHDRHRQHAPRPRPDAATWCPARTPRWSPAACWSWNGCRASTSTMSPA